MTDKNPIVVMKGITIEFPGVKALDGVDLTLYPGEVHALMGENGAGKTTAPKLLCGAIRPAGGSVELLGGSPADQQFQASAVQRHPRRTKRRYRHRVSGSEPVHQPFRR